MTRSELKTPALWSVLPLAALLADVSVRFRVIRAFSPEEWGCYLASFVLMASGFWLWVRMLRAIRRTAPRGWWLVLVPLALLGTGITGAGYAAYAANGDLPDMFLISYIRWEPENSLILFRDSFRIWQAFALAGGALAVVAWVAHLCRRSGAAPPSGRRGTCAFAGVFWLSLWYCWAGTPWRGQCYVPIVRISLDAGLYGYNEIKGVNRKPIRLPERKPLEVAVALPAPKMSVLVILNESLRRQNMGIYGYRRDTTPFMAEFAAAHRDCFYQFSSAHANASTTLLSVPSILTGISPLQPLDFRVKAPLAWQWARAAGMQSFYFTSHDMEWCGIGGFIITPPPDRFWEQRMENLPRYRDLGIDDHITVERAVEHLGGLLKSGKPFLGVVHLNTNHYPYNVRDDYRRWNGPGEDPYDNTILETDAHTRRLIETLEAAGRLRDTAVVFASDHGEGFNEHGHTAHFYCHYVETVSVPLWIYLPPGSGDSRNPADIRANLGKTVQNLDIMPTLLDMIGAWDHPGTASLREPMLGSSLLRPLPPGRTVFITNKDETLDSVIGLSSIRDGRHYLLRTSSRPAKEDLYDLTADPWERHNLWPHLPGYEKSAIRREFLQFHVASEIMRDAFPGGP